MGIEELSRSILAQAKHAADAAVHAAEKEASEIIHAEKARRALLLKSVGDEANRKLGETRSERLAWARLERKRILAHAKERAITQALDQVADYLESARKSKEYKDFVKASVDAAVAELGPKAVIHMLKGEKTLAGKMNVRIVEDLDGLGGILAESADQNVRVNLTIESVLDSKREALRKQIAKELF